MPKQPIYQFIAELDGMKPRMWRRFQTANHVPLSRFCYMVMAIFRMEGEHLFSLSVPVYLALPKDKPDGSLYHLRDTVYQFGDPDDVITADQHLPTKYKLKDIFDKVGDKAVLEYDFGDGWAVKLKLESIIMDESLPGTKLPRVLAGAGMGIIEDCGGVGGLIDLIDAYKKGSGETYEELKEWLGLETLPAFDLAAMNHLIKSEPRLLKAIYEQPFESDYQ